MRNAKSTGSFPTMMLLLALIFAFVMAFLSYKGYKLVIWLYNDGLIPLKQQTTPADLVAAPAARDMGNMPPSKVR